MSFFRLFKCLWPHITPLRRKEFSFVLVLMVLTSFAEVVSISAVLPFLSVLVAPEHVFHNPVARPLITAFNFTSAQQFLLPLTMVFIVAAFFSGAMRLILLWSQTRLGFGVGADLSTQIYEKTLYQPYSVHVTRNSSEVIAGISTKTHTVINSMLLPLLFVLSSALVLFAILAIRGKIFLQFFSSWTLMPVALLLAQILGVAQRPEFVASVLVMTSLSPIHVYINEVVAPKAVRYNQNLGIKHAVEIFSAIFFLSSWLVYRLDVNFFSGFVLIVFAQGYVWLSYLASRRVLEYQSESIIGGRYSFLIGAIIPLSFLMVTLMYWALLQLGLDNPYFIYLIIVVPNGLQYIYSTRSWIAKERVPSCSLNASRGDSREKGMFIFFAIAMLMAFMAQHWKIELAELAVGFAAISVYFISPFSSLWLIFSKSKFMTHGQERQSRALLWISPCLVISTIFLDTHYFLSVFLVAVITQVLTFKFITDVRSNTVPVFKESVNL